MFSAIAFKFSKCSIVGSLDIPQRLAVFDFVTSATDKLFDIFIYLFIFF